MNTLTSSAISDAITKHPDYSEAHDSILKMQLKKMELEERRSELGNSRADLLREQREQQLLHRVDLIMNEGNPNNAATLSALSREESELARDIRDLDAAIDIRRKELDQVERKIGKSVAAPFKGQHRDLTRKVIFAALELVAANEAEKKFRDTFRTAGVETTAEFPYMALDRIGTLQDVIARNSILGNYIADAIDHGFVTAAEVDKALAR